jgi:hypothetical protein
MTRPVDEMTLHEVLLEVGPFVEKDKAQKVKDLLEDYIQDLDCNNATAMAAMTVILVKNLAEARMSGD